MKLRFMGAEPAFVTALDRTVQPDEQVDVPDELVWDAEKNPDGLVWPEALWAEAGSGKRRTVPIADPPPVQPDEPADATKEG